MRTIITIILVACGLSPLFSEEIAVRADNNEYQRLRSYTTLFLVNSSNDISTLQKNVASPSELLFNRATTVRNIGIGLTAAGAALITTGLILDPPPYSDDDDNDQRWLSQAAVGLGLGFAVTGIYLWVAGAEDRNKQRAKIVNNPL